MGDPDGVREGVAWHRGMGRSEIELVEDWGGLPVFEAKEGQRFYMPSDIFGGDLEGIRQRLPYLAELGVSLIYLNPIFESSSNHRYNTGDYCKIDPILGDDADFRRLVSEAKGVGIRIILDGVFSHTGDDSVYFNKYGRYGGVGAYQGKESPYYSWYKFDAFPERYESWWGFESLPEVVEEDRSWQEFMISGEGSVVRHWLGEGAAGYRLDVADELPDETIELIRAAVKGADPEAFLLGEVLEDATVKQSYGKPRTYALGRGLDSVMNYPFMNRTFDFLKGKIDAWQYSRFLTNQRHAYPAPMYFSLMNLTSSHDVCRMRSVLASDVDARGMSRTDQARFALSAEEFELAGQRQRLAAAIQFSLPGIPAVYYGDEVGMTGLLDPFNRRGFFEEDVSVREWYRLLADLRNSRPVMSTGFVRFFATNGNVLAILRHSVFGRDFFGREIGSDAVLTLVNPTSAPHRIVLDVGEVAGSFPGGRLGVSFITAPPRRPPGKSPPLPPRPAQYGAAPQ
jgi:glycosidase